MSKMAFQNPVNSDNSMKIVYVLLLAVFLIPHSLEVYRVSHFDNTFTRFTLVSALWTLVHEYGSSIVGPYTTTNLILPNGLPLFWTVLFLPLHLYIVYMLSGFMKGTTTKKVMKRVIMFTLAIQIIVTGFFSYSLNGWAFGAAFPLPIIHIAVYLTVLRYQKRDVLPE